MAGLSAENKLRDVFNPRVIGDLADSISGVWPEFEQEQFLATTLSGLNSRGFAGRSALIRDALGQHLPAQFPAAVDILLKALPPELDDTGDTNWDAFIVLPLCAFVSKYGREHFDLSMNAFYEMTKRLSAEGDLRTLIEVDYHKAMGVLKDWCNDPSPHVRRLVSEGTRPRLPMAPRIKRFQQDPLPVIELLDKLKDDPSEYVRRSVANNVNDIAKDNPAVALATLQKWSKSSKPEVQWVVRHAARSLIKQGHPEAIAMLGYAAHPRITVSPLVVQPEKQKPGEAVEFSFSLVSNSDEPQKLVIDFVVHYVKARGKLMPKVFKLRNLMLQPMGNINISRKLSLVNTSGRTIYPGRHEIEIQINGKAYSRSSFYVQ